MSSKTLPSKRTRDESESLENQAPAKKRAKVTRDNTWCAFIIVLSLLIRFHNASVKKTKAADNKPLKAKVISIAISSVFTVFLHLQDAVAENKSAKDVNANARK